MHSPDLGVLPGGEGGGEGALTVQFFYLFFFSTFPILFSFFSLAPSSVALGTEVGKGEYIHTAGPTRP